MTLKTSFFNKGIYKSTLKRFFLGSVLYFIFLFIITVLSLFLEAERHFTTLPKDHFIEFPIVLHGQYITVPMFLAIIVPTIVTLLVFRFIHSKKQTIFTHSLPVSRKANYISSVIAGLTLMVVPVILNGIILLILSVTSFSGYFTPTDCLMWIFYNLYGLFLMFSASVFCATITGNSFAMIVLNILVHSLIVLIVLSMGGMARIFLYGFTDSTVLLETVSTNNFPAVVFGFTSKGFRDNISTLQYLKFAFCSLILYISSYFLIKVRRTETATDIAGFKCLNVIFKYLVTFLITLLVFFMFSNFMESNTYVFIIIVFIVSCLTYFLIQMLLRKEFNVFKSWKGFVVFTSLFAIMTIFFAETTFFGYETRIPEKQDIKEASIYNYYYNQGEPYFADSEIINMILKTHNDMIFSSDMPKVLNTNFSYNLHNYDTNIHIKYILKNGQKYERAYPVSNKKCIEIMNGFYNIEKYKIKVENVFMDDNRIHKLYFGHEDEIEKKDEFLEILREDTLNLNFEDLYYNRVKNTQPDNTTIYNIRMEFKETIVNQQTNIPTAVISGAYIEITPKYKKTIQWLKDNKFIE